MKDNWATISLIVLIALIMLIIFGSRWYNTEYAHAKNLGLSKGQLIECGKNPNCVSSQTTQSSMRIAPINASDTPELTWLMLRDLVETIPQAILISENETYRHYQFTTPLMGFIDDVELLYDRKKQLIQVKSASRVGQSDFGANRKRVELLREGLNKALSPK
ncbi:MAG: DUF1499 domain-containing protein [Pseudomonadales bacterium]|jgi:uncharacterized protein (DUF1499 family)|tara:strand:+ start:288 stop:773 length:486 start_codon:yes stop_codon:yes gene_type:complete